MATTATATTVQAQLQQRIDALKVQLKREERRGDRCAADLTQGELYGLRYALQLLQQG